MITFHWIDEEIQEIWSGITIPSKGRLAIRVESGRVELEGFEIIIKDPLSAVLIKKTIPTVINGEFWQLEIALTNYLMHGNYSIHVLNNHKLYTEFEFGLKTRKRPGQVFLQENKLLCKNLDKRVHSLKFKRLSVPDNLLLQTTGKHGVKGADLGQNNWIEVEGLAGRTQKTVAWWQIIQPSYLPLDTHYFQNKIDEFYTFNNIEYEDEPGLEISHPLLEEYGGEKDNNYPVKVIFDVLNHIHRNMRYVKQKHERGVDYALTKKRGDCTEYSAFFVTLLRKLGIKARMVSGMGRSSFNNWISHAFAEVYIFGAWIPVDVVKPPKPYLFLGNRGDLIGLNRNNWLDPKFKEFSISFMGVKGVSPKIELTQKVTETGIKKLATNVRDIKPKNKFKNLFSKGDEIKLSVHSKSAHGKMLTISQISENITTAGILSGSITFGKIIALQFVSDSVVTLDIPKDVITDKESLLLIFLNENGKLEFVKQIHY